MNPAASQSVMLQIIDHLLRVEYSVGEMRFSVENKTFCAHSQLLHDRHMRDGLVSLVGKAIPIDYWCPRSIPAGK